MTGGAARCTDGAAMKPDIDDLLLRTSRTFALAIPLLPHPSRRAVSLAYLLFRIADTFEDAAVWPRSQRIAALEAFVGLLQRPTVEWVDGARALVPGWLAEKPAAHEGYVDLVRQTPEVLAEVAALGPAMAAVLVKHTVRTAQGMAEVVARADAQGNLKLTSLQDLRDYCYIVAGIVGELLTEVFVHDTPSLRAVLPELQRRERAFGEGLQLVNILKDSGDDARDGRVYLPPGVDRDELFDLARADLEQAAQYVELLQQGGAPKGYLGFTGISLKLAFASLDRLEADGPGAKVSRLEVARLLAQLQGQLAQGGPLELRG
jgi:farnesyl-diphosphate farnesyltransferase